MSISQKSVSAKNFKHGDTGSPFYNIWQNIKKRCSDGNHKSFHRYGGRGIKVSDAWLEYDVFKKDMKKEYDLHIETFGKDNTQIERIDNDGDYTKDNCKFSTRKNQMNNREITPMLDINGIKNSLSWWSRYIGIPYHKLKYQYQRGKRGAEIFSPFMIDGLFYPEIWHGKKTKRQIIKEIKALG